MSDRAGAALRTVVVGPAGEEREAVVLRLDDGLGTVGWGEASPLPGYSPDSLDTAERALDDWVDRWLADEARTETETGGIDSSGPAGDEALRESPAAGCAADTALLDLATRRLGVPLHAGLLDLLRPARGVARGVARVPVAALVTLTGVERAGAVDASVDVLAAVADRVADGYRTVKFKLGGVAGFEAELEELTAVRAVFPYLRMRLDVNGGWRTDEAGERLASLQQAIAPEFVEQPVGAEALLELGRMPVPLAADETMRLPGALARLAEGGGCAVVVLKPMVLGGLRSCLALAGEAYENGIDVVVSHTVGGPVAHAAACELALALAAAAPASPVPAAGLGGHDDLPQRSGPWIAPADVIGHGIDAPW